MPILSWGYSAAQLPGGPFFRTQVTFFITRSILVSFHNVHVKPRETPTQPFPGQPPLFPLLLGNYPSLPLSSGFFQAWNQPQSLCLQTDQALQTVILKPPPGEGMHPLSLSHGVCGGVLIMLTIFAKEISSFRSLQPQRFLEWMLGYALQVWFWKHFLCKSCIGGWFIL